MNVHHLSLRQSVDEIELGESPTWGIGASFANSMGSRICTMQENSSGYTAFRLLSESCYRSMGTTAEPVLGTVVGEPLQRLEFAPVGRSFPGSG